MSQSRSTAFPRKKKKEELKMTNKIPHMKPPTHQQRGTATEHSLGMISRKFVRSSGFKQFYSRVTSPLTHLCRVESSTSSF